LGATLLALDAGTTGVSAVLFDADLRLLHRAYLEFPQRFPRSGWVEHEAVDILGAVDRVLAEVSAHPRASDAVALGLTNQRETIFALERRSGRALGPGIVWQDRRTEPRCAELRGRGLAADLRRRTGLVLDPYFSATKIEWRLKHEPELARRARAGEVLFGTVDTLLVAHLTGGATLATDPTNASRTLLYDLDARRFDPELCALFGAEPDWLAEVRPSTGDFGHTLPARTAGRALPIRGVAGDQQAALFGQGCFDPGTLKVTFGTGSFLLLNTGASRRDSEHGLLTTLGVGRRGEAVYALEGSVFVCGALVQWLRDQLGLITRASEIEALARSVPDSGGVFVVPAFTGLGAPYWDAGARGALLGLSRGSSRAHVARAALEALAFQNAELIDCLRADSGLDIGDCLVDGGAAENDLLMQLQADFAGLCVRRPANLAATARGAAALAGLGVGLWRDPSEPAALLDDVREFAPKLAESERGMRLADWRAAVARVRSRSRESGT
jgi:glycerol kinase